MIEINGNRLNCCESTLVKINERHRLQYFGPEIIKIGSNFGGGLAGWGSACGAATGAVMALALELGTNGDEPNEEFKAKRDQMRDITQGFLKAFEQTWGSVNCVALLGVDRRTEEGKAEYERLKAKGVFHCDDYVDWASKEIIKLIDSNYNIY
jgi:C_GCAxxG_C_C family probable redox protein